MPGLSQLITKLADGNSPNWNVISQNINEISQFEVPLDEFQDFLVQTHDRFVIFDTTRRAVLLRAMRVSLKEPAHCKILITEDIHYLILMSVERDGSQFNIERIQALKLVDKFRKIAPDQFPITWARSLVAIGNAKEDNLRKLSIDSLLELAIVNPSLVATTTGFTTLLDAILDPIFKDVLEKVLLVILHLLGDPSTRKLLSNCIDLKVLIAPFTDLDSDPTELATRWECAKLAFVTMMKTWVGILYLTADDLALPLLLKILNDAKTPFSNQEILLDCLSDVLRPIISKDCSISEIHGFRAGFESYDGLGSPQMAFTDSELAKSSSSATQSVGTKQTPKPFFSSKPPIEIAPSTTGSGNRPFSISSLFSSRTSTAFRRASVKNSITQSLSSGNLTKIEYNQKLDSRDKSEPDAIDGLSVETDTDPVFNLLDNYAAFLCCSFLHVNLLKCLFSLAVEGSSAIAEKSRKLLVEFLKLLAMILPEKSCAELLTNPTLIDIASSINSNKLFHKAHKASLILYDLASAFSVLPCRKRNAMVDDTSGILAKMKCKTISSSLPSNKSNIQVLNINSIADLSEEVVSLHLSFIPKYDRLQNGDLVSSLQGVLLPNVEKSDFLRQVDQSKVIGKEGKEPFKWDWIVIIEMLRHSFNSPERLQEALKTKWIKRLSGFFRCSIDEKGYFANLEWDGTNFHYLECACNLYAVLLKDDAGMTFLTSDRRGMLFNEISGELEQLTIMASQKSFPHNTISRNVFRATNCYYTMSREFYALLGRIVCIPGSKKLLDHTNIFDHLSKLGQYQSLDYLSRLVLTSLCFTDGGTLSKHLFYLWTNSCSTELRTYFHSLLRVMSFSAKYPVSKWFVEAIINQLLLDDSDSTLVAALNEVMHDKHNLRTIVSKKPNFFHSVDLKDSILRFLAIPEGISFFNNHNCLEDTIVEWNTIGCKQYVYNLEERLSNALFNPESYLISKLPNSISPIPMTLSICQQLFKLDHSKSVVTDSKSNRVLQNKKPFESYLPDLQGILRIPWHIEVKLSGNMQQNENEYLKVDTLVDLSDISSPLNYEVSFDANRIVKIRGIIVDSKGVPSGKLINPSTTISSTVLAGVYSILKTGQVQCSFESSTVRKRASTASTKENTQIAGSTRSFSGSNGISNNVPENYPDDLTLTASQESLCDWCNCKFVQRNGNSIDLDEGRFGIILPGEAVMYVFSKKPLAPPSTISRNSVSFDNFNNIKSSKQLINTEGSSDYRSNWNESNRFGEMVLVEIVYYFRIESGQGMFVPMPRNLFGELSRTLEGCAELAKRQLIHDLLQSARSIYDLLQKPTVSNNYGSLELQKLTTADLRSNLWSLAHIGSTEYGIAALLNIDPNFIEWCIHCVSNCNYYNVRGTFFYVLGLVSRTSQGEKKLIQNQWASSSIKSSCAVAMPIRGSSLFLKVSNMANEPVIVAPGMRRTSLTLSRLNVVQTPSMPYLNNVVIPTTSKILTPFLQPGAISVEQEIINLILKMPGVILYRECKARLLSIRQENGEVFCNRNLFMEVLNVLEAGTFKLAARRDIIDLFSSQAKLKNPQQNLPL